MRIRTGTPADAAAVSALRVSSWRAAYVGMVPEATLRGLDPRPSPESVERLRRPPADSALLVAEAGERLSGFVNVGPLRADQDPKRLLPGGEVRALYVCPQR